MRALTIAVALLYKPQATVAFDATDLAWKGYRKCGGSPAATTSFADYKSVKKIGRGDSGEVWQYRYKGKLFAVKKIHADGNALEGGVFNRVKTEHDAMKKFADSKRLMHFDEVYFTYSNEKETHDLQTSGLTHVRFVMELMAGGDVYHFMKTLRSLLTELERKRIVFDIGPLLHHISCQMIEAVSELHNKHHMYHSDINLKNFFISHTVGQVYIWLVEKRPLDKLIVKLGDFDLCTKDATSQNFTGTASYMSPEKWKFYSDNTSQEGFDTKLADVFALGVSILELHTQALPPFYHKDGNKYVPVSQDKMKVIIEVVGGTAPTEIYTQEFTTQLRKFTRAVTKVGLFNPEVGNWVSQLITFKANDRKLPPFPEPPVEPVFM